MWKGVHLLIIREMTLEDFIKDKITIFEMLVKLYSDNFGISEERSVNLSKEKLNSIPNYFKQKKLNLIGAYQDQVLIGFLWMYKHEYFGEPRLHISQIFVDKQHRGKGIGKLLLKEAEKYAKKLGVRNIDLFVSEINQNAIKMYTSLGFITERRYMKKTL